MVMSPKEAKGQAYTRYEMQLKEMEKTIDDKLSKSLESYVTVKISRGYSGPYDSPNDNVPYDVIDKFLDSYRSVGWDAKIQSDQREGSWIEFKEKKTTYERKDSSPGEMYFFKHHR